MLVDQDTWIVFCFITDIDIQHIAAESDNDDSDSKNSEDIVAVRFFIGELKLKKPVVEFVESIASSSLETYLRQKDDNGHNKNELSLSQKEVQIDEVIGESKVIVDITFESGNTNQCIVQLADIISQAATFAVANPTSCTHLLLKVFDRIKQKQWVEAKFLWVENLSLYNKLKTGCVSLFESLSELFFEQFFRDSLNWNLLIVKSTIMTSCNSDYCSKKIMLLANIYNIVLIKPQLSVLSGEGTYFKTWLKHWQEPLKVARINITDERFYLECKDLPEEISFPSEDAYIKQRYRLMGASFCDGNHHVADVCFENIKNAGWYQYDSLEKTYHAQAIYIGSLCSLYKNGYAMVFAIYVKI
ncbi:hypothetical protein F8M41_000641 [Gigaspora margarita]|uniref:Uncharacterized protein n=1 Tax=Gigaspora margarita TaxID=4874 RepID=A0A8H3XH90_GIGMA|nr:hypothetical protein F8M41_000641 [Gigaspora margarita]